MKHAPDSPVDTSDAETLATKVLGSHDDEATVTLPGEPEAPSAGKPSKTSAGKRLIAASLAQRVETEVASPKQAMYLEEIRRMRFFTVFGAFSSAALCVVLPFLPGDPTARKIHWAAAALATIAALVLAFILRDGARYKLWMGTVLGMTGSLAISTGFYFWGVYSAVLLVVPIGTYFFALGESYRSAVAIHALGAGTHLLVSILQLTGTIPDVGLIQPQELTTFHQIGLLLALQGVFSGAFVMARALRSSSLDTLKRLDGAVRDIAQREALLEEAKVEIARVRKAGAPGRFTGQELDGFRLGNILGRGAMGDVYEAVSIESGELAAVKMLNRDAMANPDLVARFYRELEIARSIQAENVVKVLGFPSPDAPLPYLAMERLRGETLSDILRNRTMPHDEMLGLVEALARGISAAHRLGIVHRDLKPQNIIAHQSKGKTIWKILDFGVSKLIDQSGTLTQGLMVGTPAYMSPEQASGEEVDGRADLYAIGVILYRVLTGRAAIRGASLPMILRAVNSDMPQQPSSIAQIPEELDLVLAIAMAKHPKDRFSDADELASAMRSAAKGDLSQSLRSRAKTLIAKYPWGQRNVC